MMLFFHTNQNESRSVVVLSSQLLAVSCSFLYHEASIQLLNFINIFIDFGNIYSSLKSKTSKAILFKENSSLGEKDLPYYLGR